MILTALITVIGAYLLGSINFAVIFSNIFLKKDVREMGSGNAGATNVMRSAGVLPGILTFVCDALKGFVSALTGKLIFAYIFNAANTLATGGRSWANPVYGAYICGVACILGHVLPIFFNFKGGKGVAVSVGIFYVCCPTAISVGLGIFIILVLLTKIVSLSSLFATFIVVALSIVLYNKDAGLVPQLICSLFMGAVIFIKHSENIKRLISGEEKKIHIKRN